MGFRPDIWKSSPLALLYHGLLNGDEPTSKEQATGDFHTTRSMKARAETTIVQLGNLYGQGTHLEVQRSSDT